MQTIQEQDRLPPWMYLRPTFLMDARRDPNTPSAGNTDASPTNLSGASDCIAASPSGEEPTWNGDAWSFETGHSWKVQDFPRNPRSMLFWAVVDPADSVNSSPKVLFRHDTIGSSGARVYLWLKPEAPEMRLAIRDGSGTETTQRINTSFSDPYARAIVTFAFHYEHGIRLTWDSNVESLQETVSGLTYTGDFYVEDQHLFGDNADKRSWEGSVETCGYATGFSTKESSDWVRVPEQDRLRAALADQFEFSPASNLEPRTISEGIRTRSTFPVSFDVHLDHASEVDPPIEREPTNWVVESDVQPLQTNNVDFPTWTPDYWDFQESKWEIPPQQISIDQMLMAGVGFQDEAGSRRIAARVRSDGLSRLRYWDSSSSNQLSALLENASGTRDNLGISNTIDVTQPTAWVWQIDLVNGNNFLIARNANTHESSSNSLTGTLGNFNGLRIGHTGSLGLIGGYYAFFLSFRTSITLSQGEIFSNYLREKYLL